MSERAHALKMMIRKYVHAVTRDYSSLALPSSVPDVMEMYHGGGFMIFDGVISVTLSLQSSWYSHSYTP